MTSSELGLRFWPTLEVALFIIAAIEKFVILLELLLAELGDVFTAAASLRPEAALTIRLGEIINR